MTTTTNQPDRKPSNGWIADEAKERIRTGDTQVLLRAIVMQAETWTRIANVPLEHHERVRHSHVAGGMRRPMSLEPPNEVQRAFLAAGCDLLDLMKLSPVGRQVIEDICNAVPAGDATDNPHPDDAAVDQFAVAMKTKLQSHQPDYKESGS